MMLPHHTGLLGLVLLLATVCSTALAQDPVFPELSGRVVDNAGMISSATEKSLNARLRAHEQATGEQVVVATLPDLQGYSIEEFGYQLGRHWGIGEKDKDTGALLLVAKEERAIRIEVGYGLEGRLTDALSGQIISRIISPRFKQGDFDGGISQGVDAMLAVLGGDAKVAAQENGGKRSPVGAILFLIVMAIMMIGGGRGGRGLLGGFLLGSMLGGRGGGGFGGGGFSGGGGGFGGGGASGGW